MSVKLINKLDKITSLQTELQDIKDKISSIKSMMLDYHRLNIQNANLSISFTQNLDETDNQMKFKTWMDLQREEIMKSNPLFRLFGAEPSVKNSQVYSIEFEINPIMLSLIIEVLNANLKEKEKAILFELKNYIK